MSKSIKILSGKIRLPNDKILEIKFAIAEFINGCCMLEVYFEPNFNHNELWQDEKGDHIKGYRSLTGETDDGKTISINNLQRRNSDGHIEHRELYESFGSVELSKTQNQDSNYLQLSSVLLEGLEMRFSEMSYFAGKIKGLDYESHTLPGNQSPWDHSIINIEFQEKKIRTIWSQYDSDSVEVRFIDSSSFLTKKEFDEVKLDFLSLLSLANGAFVNIRETCYSGENSEFYLTQINSRETLIIKRKSDFIPIRNDGNNRQTNILGELLENNFKAYIEQNNSLDLNTVIFHLCTSTESITLEARVFVQMIAFERLSEFYANKNEPPFIKPISDEQKSKNLKKDLKKVLEKHEDSFDRLFSESKSTILNFNHKKRSKTDIKMKNLVRAANLDVTEQISNLIDSYRHSVIHIGDIESSTDIDSFLVLDETLRRIILKLIRYKGFINTDTF